MILAWPILYGIRDAGVGLGGKIASNSISFRERMYLLEIAFSSSNPIFGDGTSSLYRLNEGISLISQIRIYGFIYFVLVLSIYLLATRNFTLFLIGLFPAIITALVSQPIAVDVPFVLMFMSYAALDRNAWAVDTRARPEVIGNIASTADRV
jgi:hypothetical protein